MGGHGTRDAVDEYADGVSKEEVALLGEAFETVSKEHDGAMVFAWDPDLVWDEEDLDRSEWSRLVEDERAKGKELVVMPLMEVAGWAGVIGAVKVLEGDLDPDLVPERERMGLERLIEAGARLCGAVRWNAFLVQSATQEAFESWVRKDVLPRLEPLIKEHERQEAAGDGSVGGAP
jgi:hypothetical protein